MRNFDVLKTTTDSSTYNKIICYHANSWSNRKRRKKRNKWYGQSSYILARIKNPTIYPSWKLVSKCSKQWMKKPIKFEEFKNWWGKGFEIKW